MAEANEPPTDALRRELREELGLDLQVGDLLCIDWVSPHGPWDDLLNLRTMYLGRTWRIPVLYLARICRRIDLRPRPHGSRRG